MDIVDPIESNLVPIGDRVAALLQEIGGEEYGFVLITIPKNRSGNSWAIKNVPERVAATVLKAQAERARIECDYGRRFDRKNRR